MTDLTGGLTNYYLAEVKYPQRKEQQPYQAECEDIIAALKMDFNEGCEFKAIWRTAAARLGNGKPGQKAVYDAEKRVHYANRSLLSEQRAAGLWPNPEPVPEPKGEGLPDQATLLRLMAGLGSGALNMDITAPGERPKHHTLPLETFCLGSSDVHFWPVNVLVTQNDWVDWAGGSIDVTPPNLHGQMWVDVHLRSGSEVSNTVRKLRWDHLGAPGDIIAYRISKKQEGKA